MSVLVSLGILTSYLFSLALTLFVPGQETFYEAAVTLAVFLLLGHWIEMKARRGSSDSVRKLLDLAPQTATVEREDRQVEVPVAEVRVGNGGWTLNRGAAIAVPPVIRELILERLSTLEPSARRVLELLSVWESTTPHRVLREAGDLDEDVLLNALHRLRAAHLVVEEVGPEGVCYATSHPLIQEVAHAELGAMARVRMHAAFARALEQWRPDDLERLAYHYRLAGTEAEPGRALEVLLAAGEHARELHAYEEAARQYEAALRLVREGHRVELLPMILEHLGVARDRLGEGGAAIALWTEAIAHYAESGAQQAAARLHRLAAATEWERGGWNASQAH